MIKSIDRSVARRVLRGSLGQRRERGMTVIEIMVVLAIIAGLFFVARTGFRTVTKADLVEDANELATLLRRASTLSVERGELHRVTFDIDTGGYVVEVCQGAAAIQRNEKLRNDDEDTKRAIERGKQRMINMPADALAAGDPDEATHRALALAGSHVADRTCVPATGGFSGDASGKGWLRKLHKDSGVKLKEIWVQHRDDGVTKGQVAIYFFPLGSSEKSVLELTDGNDTFSVLVYGLTGRVELRDGEVKNIDDHMLKNVMGNRDAKREDQR
jgi:prepilin-type N-terminal cleavage/methylation domain-containing protein